AALAAARSRERLKPNRSKRSIRTDHGSAGLVVDDVPPQRREWLGDGYGSRRQWERRVVSCDVRLAGDG
ncbi:MAG TPA: hypothetical protein PKU97_24125, partial [Kofleriaceae bacterium]|nr:hypothetical protein [Kofleriaceae bacterium]